MFGETCYTIINTPSPQSPHLHIRPKTSYTSLPILLSFSFIHNSPFSYRSFLAWLVKTPTEKEQLRARQITTTQVIVEMCWLVVWVDSNCCHIVCLLSRVRDTLSLISPFQLSTWNLESLLWPALTPSPFLLFLLCIFFLLHSSFFSPCPILSLLCLYTDQYSGRTVESQP